MLLLKPSAIAAQAAVGFHDPVAGNHDREGVHAACRADRAHGLRLARPLGDPRVALPFPKADLLDRFVHASAKALGEGAVKGEREGPTVACEEVEDLVLRVVENVVRVERARRVDRWGEFPQLRFAEGFYGIKTLAFESDAHEPPLSCGEKESAERGGGFGELE